MRLEQCFELTGGDPVVAVDNRAKQTAKVWRKLSKVWMRALPLELGLEILVSYA